MSRTVFSAANEPVEIMSDDDWKQTLDLRSLPYATADRVTLLQALWHHGTITESHGLATTSLRKAAEQYGYVYEKNESKSRIATMLKSMGPAIERETKGKRTFRIRLIALPERWYKQVNPNGDQPAATPEPVVETRIYHEEPAPEQKPEFPPGATTPEPEPELVQSPYLEVLPQVAMSLLTQVVEIISAGKPEMIEARVKQLNLQLDDALRRLADSQQHSEALRRQLRGAGDELSAVKHERDGLRARLRQTEYNLKQAMSNDAMKQVDERVRDELAKVMRAVPESPHGHGG